MKKQALLSALFAFLFSFSSIQAQTWNTVGDSTQIINYDSVTPEANVFVAKPIDSLLYVGGAFQYAGKMKVMGITTWNGTKWDSLRTSINPQNACLDVCKYNNDIFWG